MDPESNGTRKRKDVQGDQGRKMKTKKLQIVHCLRLIGGYFGYSNKGKKDVEKCRERAVVRSGPRGRKNKGKLVMTSVRGVVSVI